MFIMYMAKFEGILQKTVYQTKKYKRNSCNILHATIFKCDRRGHLLFSSNM